MITFLLFFSYSSQIKEAWDDKASVEKNLRQMGLSTDPNETICIPKTKVHVISSRIVRWRALFIRSGFFLSCFFV